MLSVFVVFLSLMVPGETAGGEANKYRSVKKVSWKLLFIYSTLLNIADTAAPQYDVSSRHISQPADFGLRKHT